MSKTRRLHKRRTFRVRFVFVGGEQLISPSIENWVRRRPHKYVAIADGYWVRSRRTPAWIYGWAYL